MRWPNDRILRRTARAWTRAAMDIAPIHPVRLTLAGMIGMAVIMGIGRFVYTPILPGMMAALGLSASDAGLIASANYLGYLVGAVVCAGAWAAGRELAMMRAWLVASALLAAAMGLTDNLVAFVVIRFFAGVASAAVMIFLTGIVFARLGPAGRGDLQVWHFGGVGLGIAVSGAMTGGLYLFGAAWPAGWLLSGALSAVGAAFTWVMITHGPEGAAAARAEPPLPRHMALARLIAAYGLFGFGYVITATFLITITRQGHAGPLYESAVWLATGLAGLPSVWLWMKVARRIGLFASLAAACVLEAAGVTASVELGGLVGPMLGGVLLGGTFIAITAQGIIAGRTLAGRSPRRVLALMTAAFGIGQILGPIAAGYAAVLTGSFTMSSLGAAAVLVVAAALVWRLEFPDP